MGLADQLDSLAPVRGARHPCASSEQIDSPIFRSSSKAAICTVALSFRCCSILRALISSWSSARSFSRSSCSFKVSTYYSLASWAACRHLSTCSRKRPRSRQSALISVTIRPAVSDTNVNVSRTPDLCFLLGCRHHLSLQPQGLPPVEEGDHGGAQLF